MMGRKRRFISPVFLALIGLVVDRAFASEFLPDVPVNLGYATVTSYTSEQEYDSPGVVMGPNNVGAIGYLDFSYATWTGSLATGGAALAGGFYETANSKFTPQSGWEFDWVQVVTATNPGTNAWNAVPDQSFPDTLGNSSPNSNPNYPLQSLPTTVSFPPTVEFQDFPNRYPSDGAQSWLAELGLVYEDPTTHQMDVLGTFDWGFGINTSGAFTPDPPTVFGTPSADYITTLEEDFPNWKIEAQSVPEPSTFVLFSGLAVMGLVAGYRRRKRAAA
jgi:hypothetical protein